MTTEVSFEDIKEVLAQHARLPVDVAGLGPDDDLYHTGMTSHAAVSVMIGLEEAFDVEFPQEILQKDTFATMASIKRVVERLQVGLAAAPPPRAEPVR